MVSISRRNVVLAVLGLVVAYELLAPDDYARVLAVHVDVLEGMTEKVATVAAAGGRPTPNDLTEMIYPLERARGFVDQYNSENRHQSYVAFTALVDEYAALVTAIDSSRGIPERWESFRGELRGRVEQVRSAVVRVRAALAEES